MADLSQVTLPSGSTYNFKDTTARNAIRVWYGTCSTAENTQTKEVTVVAPTTPQFNFTSGNIIVVKFDNAMGSIDLSQYSWSLKVGANTGTILTYQYDGNPGATGKNNNLWGAGSVVTFVYIGSNNFVVVSVGGNYASTETYGITKLSNSTTSTSTVLAATPKAVKDALDAAKSYADSAIIGNASFQGIVTAPHQIPTGSAYKKGWYWVVGASGTYVGNACEIGDFIFCVSDRGDSYAASDFSVVQANIDMSIFGALAYKDTATGSTTVAVPKTYTTTVTPVAKNVSVSGTTTGSITPTKSTVTVSNASSGTATYTPAGTVSTPTITVTPNTTTVNSITAVGTLPSCTLPVFSTSVSGETLTLGWSAGSFSAGTLPTKGSNTTVATGIKSATSTQPSFTGTGARLVTDSEVMTGASFVGASMTSSGSYTPAAPTATTTTATTENKTVSITVS